MIRILVVDDQKLIREGIKILLEKKTEIEIVADASNAGEALEKIELHRPDVVLLDIAMPGVDGLAVADKIRFKFPEIKIIMLSSHEDESYVRKATELGSKGYLLKSASSQELEWSIKLVHQGYSAIKSELLEKHLSSERQNQPQSESNSNFRTDKREDDFSKAMLSQQDRVNSDQLELLLAKNHVKQKYSAHQQQKRSNSIFHRANLSRVKKTVTSFEFSLLAFAVLFCLGFLVFVALS